MIRAKDSLKLQNECYEFCYFARNIQLTVTQPTLGSGNVPIQKS